MNTLVLTLAAAKSKPDPAQVVFHQDLFKSLVIFFVVCAAWGFATWLTGRQFRPGSYPGALIIGEGLIVIQGLSGLLLVATGFKPHDGLHWLYGFILLVTLPVIYMAWAQHSDERRAALYYALGCTLIVVIAVVRSSGTGG